MAGVSGQINPGRNMNIFCDYHHHDLYTSLIQLFEVRLGYNMYRQIGMEWKEQGFWNVYPHPATALQYLGLHQGVRMKDMPGSEPPDWVKINPGQEIDNDVYYVKDNTYGRPHKAITLDKFRSMKFDILVASIPEHVGLFKTLIQQFQPDAKLIFQVGNPGWSASYARAGNVMCSIPHTNSCGARNIVFYHQELSPKLFFYEPPKTSSVVNSYVHYMERLDRLAQYRAALPNMKFTTYGSGMEDHLPGGKHVAQAMRDSGWTWHYKPIGDGFGHVIHATYACGRPTIIDTQPYRGQPAYSLLEDKVTCIDISKRTLRENVALINLYSEPDKHALMCERARQRFDEVVNYNEEEKQIRAFLERLV